MRPLRKAHPIRRPPLTAWREPVKLARTARGRRAAAAMILAALLAVTSSIPAMAFNLDASAGWTSVDRMRHGSQSLLVGSAQAAPIQRDGYKVTKTVKLGPGAYTRTAPTYVNYPSSPIQWPFLVGVPISSDFGPRIAPCAGCSSLHKGIDMTPGANTPIQAIAAGVVREVSAYDSGGYGVYAIIDHEIDGQKVASVYAHMAAGSLSLAAGQAVEVGDQVGNVGSSGESTGAHLHLEVRIGDVPIDPFAWLKENVR